MTSLSSPMELLRYFNAKIVDYSKLFRPSLTFFYYYFLSLVGGRSRLELPPQGICPPHVRALPVTKVQMTNGVATPFGS